MIPKLIHQTAKTADLDPRLLCYQAKVRELHPDWKYKLWTDSENDAFVRTEYPDFYATWLALPKNIMRADVIRYLLMDKLGGLYLDTDYEMLRPFDLLHYAAVVPWESDEVPGKSDQRLGNDILAACPGHPFFRRVIEVLQSRDPLPPDSNVLTTTGPAFITSVYRAMRPDEQAQVHTPNRNLFNPVAPGNARKRKALIAKENPYGIHHCFSSWREFTPTQKLRNALSHFYHRFR